jgi:tetratricopeptide (TPR) repeat protein
MHTAISLGRPREAAEHFEALDFVRLAAEVGPLAKPEFVYWGAHAYHLLGEDDQALGIARDAIEESPEDEGLRRVQIAALAALSRSRDLAAAIDEWFQVATQVGMHNPFYAMHHVIGELRTHGCTEEASELAHRLVQWYEGQGADDPSVRGRKAIALYCAEEWEEAAVLLEQLLLELPDNETTRGTLAAITARQGNRQEALGILGELPEGEAQWAAAGNTFWHARIAALLGEEQSAVDLLKAAIAQGALVVPAQAHYHMDFEPLRDYPPFKEFVRPKG